MTSTVTARFVATRPRAAGRTVAATIHYGLYALLGDAHDTVAAWSAAESYWSVADR